MKTFEQKAYKLVKEFADLTGIISEDGQAFHSLWDVIYRGLKEQDRDTRHVCSDSIINYANGFDDIDVDTVGRIIMNVKAG